ncbi:MAG: acetolactate synthase small subunit [Desulfohalobiaceae bacterium]
MRHILSIQVENEPGVLSRVAGLFSGRGFNIESLNVAPTLEEGVSHMTIVTRGDDQIIEQIIKQLRKVVTVIKVVDLTHEQSVEREMVLLKINAEGNARPEILRIVDIFRCKVVDVSLNELIIEVTGDAGKIRALTSLLQRFGIKEVARTGGVAMRRSMQLH